MGSVVPTNIVDVVGLVPRVWVMVRDGSIGFLDSPISFKKRFMIVRIAVCGVLCAVIKVSVRGKVKSTYQYCDCCD